MFFMYVVILVVSLNLKYFSPFFYSQDGVRAFKICEMHGQWEAFTNYTECLRNWTLTVRHQGENSITQTYNLPLKDLMYHWK